MSFKLKLGKNRETKVKALFLIGFFVAIAFAGTFPMMLGAGTDGGGATYYWDSATMYADPEFTASAYRTGFINVRKTTPGQYGRLDAHLTKDYTPSSSGYIQVRLNYQFNWYTDYYHHVAFGCLGLTDPIGGYITSPCSLVDPYDYSRYQVASDYQSYTYTYLHVGCVTTFIPVSAGVTYELKISLVVVSTAPADRFSLISSSTSSALFFCSNQITFFSSIP